MSQSYGGDEYEYEWPDDGDAGQEGWGSDDQADEDNPRIQIENTFYEAEGNMKEDPK